LLFLAAIRLWKNAGELLCLYSGTAIGGESCTDDYGYAKAPNFVVSLRLL